MVMSQIGLTDREVDEILKQEGIKAGNPTNAEDLRKAISKVIQINNEKIKDFLEKSYIDYVDREMGRKSKMNSRGFGIK